MMEKAKQCLEASGWRVVGGCLAPASDSYVRGKMWRLWRPSCDALPFALRARTCELVCQDMEWLTCDRRGGECYHAPDMGRRLLCTERPGEAIFSVIGADVAQRGVRDDFPHVVVARAGSDLGDVQATPRRLYIAEAEEADYSHFSSTAVREAMGAGNWDTVASQCGAAVANELRERLPPPDAPRGTKRSLGDD